MGLVHIRNQVKQYRKIGVNETLTLSCKFGELQPHDKGRAVDFITTVKVGGEVVVEALTTYLSRQKTNAKAAAKPAESQAPEYILNNEWKHLGEYWSSLCHDLRRLYLDPYSCSHSESFWFKQAIAHGMWSKAKALANLSLPDAYEADVWFKLPMYLPSKVEFLTAQAANDTDFLIRSSKNQKPHVTGHIKAFKSESKA